MTTKTITPPVASLYSLPIEEAFVGSMLIDPEGIRLAQTLVAPTDLSLANGLVYGAMIELFASGQAVDFVTVVEALERSGGLEDSGGKGRVAALVNAVPSSVHLPTYAAKLNRLATLRKFVDVASQTVRRAHAGDADPLDLMAWVEAELNGLRLRAPEEGGALAGEDFLPWYETLLREREQARTEGTLRPFDWPWKSWNKRIRPMRAGTLGVLVAPDGGGKSVALEMIAEHWARRGHKVLLVHLEDETEIKADRRVARWSGIPLEDLEAGRLSPEQWAKWQEVENAIAENWGANLRYQHAPGWRLNQILAAAERLRIEGRCDGLVIDYVNKIDADADILLRTRDDWRRDALIIERLRTFGEKTRIPIVTAAQMNKEGKAADVRTVTRNAARGTGELSEKAQLVITLARELAGPDGIYTKDGKKIAEEGQYSPILTVRIDKQNRGVTGVLPAQWLDGPRFRIFDLVEEKR